jgi:hypothetical protein
MSIGELAGLYERGELDVHPKFQRILRWSDGQKAKLIESLLLRIPIPPIFVAQDEKGHWDVVDGVQRLGTILEFLGMLRDAEGVQRPSLQLVGTKLLPALLGVTFKEGGASRHPLGVSQQLDFRRLRLDVNIILKESDPSSKYELFERLNTGGSIASEQEVRNCVMVWMNEPLFDWLKDKLAAYEPFQACVQLTDRQEENQYRMELVLRFLAFYEEAEADLKKVQDIGEFLNDRNRTIAADASYAPGQHQKRFFKTFDLLSQIGADAFRKYEATQKAFRGGFLISAFEAVALGVAFNLAAWERLPDPKPRLTEKIKQMWSERDFFAFIGTGVPARDRIRHSIPFGRAHFKP